jgi:hypothetical protein
MCIRVQDTWGEHACTLLKYFISEGLACQQQLLHVHDGCDSDGLLSQLPKLVEKSETGTGQDGGTSASSSAVDALELKIAWQYKRCVYLSPCLGHACTDASLCGTLPCTCQKAPCQTLVHHQALCLRS